MMVKFRWFEYRSANDEQPILIALSTFLGTIADQFEAYDSPAASFNNVKKETERMRRTTKKVNSTIVVDYDSECASNSEQSSDNKVIKRQTVTTATQHEKEARCALCNQAHVLKQCPKFMKASVNERWDLAKKYRTT